MGFLTKGHSPDLSPPQPPLPHLLSTSPAAFLLYYLLLSMLFGVCLLTSFAVPGQRPLGVYIVTLTLVTCSALLALDFYLGSDSKLPLLAPPHLFVEHEPYFWTYGCCSLAILSQPGVNRPLPGRRSQLSVAL